MLRIHNLPLEVASFIQVHRMLNHPRGASFRLFSGVKEHIKLHISNLLFANDTSIFCGVNPISAILDFKVVSGLKIYLAKSELVHVGN